MLMEHPVKRTRIARRDQKIFTACPGYFEIKFPRTTPARPSDELQLPQGAGNYETVAGAERGIRHLGAVQNF